jgi:hypothetical protein
MSSKLAVLLLLATAIVPSVAQAAEGRPLPRTVLRDKIRGAWAGQMLGVVYGAKVEFKALGRIYEEEIKPAGMDNVIYQDDLYVEMTFARVMDTLGLEATTADYGEAFRQSKYELWHANAGARRNLNRGLAAPLSGDPRYNIHTDDIDFQIESDFIGIMCPGLPQAANHYAGRVGRVMNSGDGLYGGMFIGGMYAAAYFETAPRKVVEAGLACIPAESAYAAVLRDLLAWSAEEPADWRKVWGMLGRKWDRDDVCPDGAFRPFNIDAKLNGAYVALGLLYGRGEWQRTLEIAARCGQDADCNPSNAAGVLGAILGYDRLPAAAQADVARYADTKFSFTDYSFNTIVQSTETRALQVIRLAGGTVSDTEVVVPRQAPQAPPWERSPFGVPVGLLGCDDAGWQWTGPWAQRETEVWAEKIRTREATGAGSEATLTFTGSGVALIGDLSGVGGRADVFVDGVKSELVAEAYIVPSTHDNDLWRIFGLKPGAHIVRLVMRDDADPRSAGRKLSIYRAVVYSSP